MNSDMRRLKIVMVVMTLLIPCGGLAQKIKVGYDKGADFSKYKSYTLQLPATNEQAASVRIGGGFYPTRD